MKQLNHFLNFGINQETLSVIHGGKKQSDSNIFCEWYVGYCEDNGIDVSKKDMKKFAKLDNMKMKDALKKGKKLLNKFNYFG